MLWVRDCIGMVALALSAAPSQVVAAEPTLPRCVWAGGGDTSASVDDDETDGDGFEGSRLLVWVSDASACHVRVGGVEVGVAPLVGKVGPVGLCDLEVTCGKSRRWQSTLSLEPGAIGGVRIKQGQIAVLNSRASRSFVEQVGEKGTPLAASELYEIGRETMNDVKALPMALDAFAACVRLEPKNCQCLRAVGLMNGKLQRAEAASAGYRAYLSACPAAGDADEVARLLDAYQAQTEYDVARRNR